MSVREEKAGFVFTGKHMLGVLVLFFGTIISVNLVMAYYASSTWSGLVVQNTYVASQQFNAKASAIREMLASGIKGELEVSDQTIRYRLTLPENRPLAADKVTAHFKRPVGEHQDFVAELSALGDGVYGASHEVLAGEWIVELIAVKDGKTIMHEAPRIALANGRMILLDERHEHPGEGDRK
ncbi:MAG: FixH family protein [Rhizobiaceae bacterium]|nr:FixH family protein [Rhizobiaceae bacterium]